MKLAGGFGLLNDDKEMRFSTTTKQFGKTISLLMTGGVMVLSPFTTAALAGQGRGGASVTSLPVRTWDVFLGDGRKNAYPLGWKNVQTGDVAFLVVNVDGVAVARDAVRVDGGKGEITFVMPILRGAFVYVAYEYLPDKNARRERETPGVTAPLTIPVRRIGSDSSLEFVALPSVAEKSVGYVWRHSGRGSLFGGALTSQILFQPKNSWNAEDTGVALGYRLGEDKNRYSVRTDYRRAGRDFAGDAGARLGFGEMTERMTLAGRARPTDFLNLSTNFAETENFQNEDVRRQMEIALALRERKARWTLEIARKSDANAPGDDKKPDTETVAGNIAVTLKPDPRISVSLAETSETRRTENADAVVSETTTREQSARAEIVPIKDAKLTGALTWNRPAAGGNGKPTPAKRNGDFGATLRRGRLEASGAYQSRNNALDTTRGNFTIKPVRGWTLSGGLTRNPADGGTPTDALRREYGLSTRLLGFVELGGGYGLTDFGDEETGDVGDWKVDLSLRLGARTRLFGNYQNRFGYGITSATVGLQTYGLGFAHELGNWFNLSLGGTTTRDRAQIGQPADVKGEAKLGVRF